MTIIDDDHPGWNLIPTHMREGLQRYINHGIAPGDFLSAVLSNDLRGAVERADDVNIVAIPNYIKFLYNYAPGGCWGSVERYKSWTGTKGAE